MAVTWLEYGWKNEESAGQDSRHYRRSGRGKSREVTSGHGQSQKVVKSGRLGAKRRGKSDTLGDYFEEFREQKWMARESLVKMRGFKHCDWTEQKKYYGMHDRDVRLC